MKWLLCTVFSLLLVAPAMAQTTKPTLWIIGDSTVRNGTKGQVGWGDPIKKMFDLSKIDVQNKAIGGRSSRTFRTEGRWEEVLKNATPGDFVLMQFGHNDSGPLAGDNRERGSIRGEDDKTEDVTLKLKDNKPETVHTYGWYMRQYVKEAREHGLTPIVCSYVPRCPRADPNKPEATSNVPPEITSYALWSKNAAEAEKGHFIDLNTRILKKWEGKTPDELKKAYFTDADFTHTSEAGATLNAQCVVEGIRDLKDVPLKDYLAK